MKRMDMARLGAKDRATNRVSAAVVEGTDATTLQSFVEDRVVVQPLWSDHTRLSQTVYSRSQRRMMGDGGVGDVRQAGPLQPVGAGRPISPD